MVSRREIETVVARGIKLAIAKPEAAVRARLVTLEPLEAIVLLGNLAVETLARFPQSERMQITESWIKEIRESVQEATR